MPAIMRACRLLILLYFNFPLPDKLGIQAFGARLG